MSNIKNDALWTHKGLFLAEDIKGVVIERIFWWNRKSSHCVIVGRFSDKFCSRKEIRKELHSSKIPKETIRPNSVLQFVLNGVG